MAAERDSPRTGGLERFLTEAGLFEGAEARTISSIARASASRSFRRGQAILEAGEIEGPAFVVRSGLVWIVGSGEEDVIAEVRRGELFGEMSALTGEPRSARAVAATNAEVVEIPAEALLTALRENPGLYTNLFRDLARRLKRRLPNAIGGLRTCAFVGTKPEPTISHAIRVAEHVASLDGAPVGLLLAGMPSQERSGLPPTVVPVHEDPAANFVDQLVASGERFRRLIVATAPPKNGAERKRLNACGAVFALSPIDGPALGGLRSVRRTVGEEAGERMLRAIAREIAGRRNALVLGAGGAKGFAHIGALAAFERAGLEFDAVAGTSIGGIVGALHASGLGVAVLDEIFLGVAKPWQALLDPAAAGSNWSRQKTEMLESYCANRSIEDLATPFFTVAGDLTTLAPVVFRDGPLAIALDATSAIPSIFEPIRLGSQLLVDGWVCNPLPADVVSREGYERIVAVDLTAGAPPAHGELPSDGQGRRLELALRALEIGSRAHVERNVPLIDDLVRPALEGFASTDVTRARELRDCGEEAAARALGSGALEGTHLPY